MPKTFSSQDASFSRDSTTNTHTLSLKNQKRRSKRKAVLQVTSQWLKQWPDDESHCPIEFAH